MSTLAKQLYAASCANASLEQLIGTVDNPDLEIPAVQMGAGEIEAKEFAGNVDAVERITQLVSAAATAQDAQEVVGEVEEVRDTAEELRDGVATVNEISGGASLESFPYIQLAADRIAARVGLPAIALGVSIEDFNGDKTRRIRVSTAGLESLLSALDSSSATVLRDSQDRLAEMVSAIRAAMPDVRDRLMTLLSDLDLSTGDLAGQVNINPAVVSALSVDGAVPEDLVSFFSTYATYGKTLTNDYSRRTATAAEQVSGLLGSLNYITPEGFWDSLDVALDKIGDPRGSLPADHVTLALPGSGPLFDTSITDVPEGNPTFQKLAKFINSNKPIISIDSEADEQEYTDSSSTVPSLTREQIRQIAKSLLDAACPESLDEALKIVEKNWISSQASLAEARDTVRNITGQVQQSLGVQLDLVPRFVETLHRLSIWPQVNFITNLIFTANAFVLLGSEMVNGERAPEETLEEGLDDGQVIDPNADPLIPDAADATGVLDSDPAADTTGESTKLDEEGVSAASDIVGGDGDEAAGEDTQTPHTSPEDVTPPTADEPASDAAADQGDTSGDAGDEAGSDEGDGAPQADDASDASGDASPIPDDVSGNPDEIAEDDETFVPPLKTD